MALKNRTEVSAAIQAQAAILGETEYKEGLDDNFAQSCVLRKDVSASESTIGNTHALDFTDIDYIEVAQNAPGTTTYTITGVQQGEIKFLKITKSSLDSSVFSGDITPDPSSPDVDTEVFYYIFNKDGNTKVLAISAIVREANTAYPGILETATGTEAKAFAALDKIITPSNLEDIRATTALAQAFTSIKSFLTPGNLTDVRASSAQTTAGAEANRFVSPSTLRNIESTSACSFDGDWAGTFKVRKDIAGNVLMFSNCDNVAEISAESLICTIPAGYRPAQTMYIVAPITFGTGSASRVTILRVETDGEVYYLPTVVFQLNWNLNVNASFRIDSW